MSVENFIQESFFSGEEAIFASVPTITPIRSRKKAVLEPSLPEFRVVRSTRRKRGVTAFRSNGVIEIHMPDRTSRRAERELIPEMIALVLRREAQQRRTDDLLHEIATRLLAQYLPEFHERPSSIRWRSMQGRWGSCTTVDRTIRVAERLASAPEYVLECVILHELIHLRLPGHGSDFHSLLERYPDLARAESYLEGFEAGLGAPPELVTTQEL